MAIGVLRLPAVRTGVRVPSIRVLAQTQAAAGLPWAVPCLATVAALLGMLWSWHAGLLTSYGDARAHLNIARHVTDGLTPGPAQLGTVWLPVQHILLSPLVAIEPLWHSGLAGAIVGGACFVYSCIRIFTLGEEWLGSRRCAWVAFLLFAGNVNLLYLQSTALTEPVLLAFFIGSVHRLARWLRTMEHRELLVAALLASVATLTRYDGWALLGVALVVVAAWSWTHERRRGATEANLVMFASVGGFGIALWVIYNLVLFGDPLYFMHSSFSAQAQQASLLHSGLLNTRGSLGVSAATYAWAVIDIVGRSLTRHRIDKPAWRARGLQRRCALGRPEHIARTRAVAVWDVERALWPDGAAAAVSGRCGAGAQPQSGYAQPVGGCVRGPGAGSGSHPHRGG
jgi:hypothetical protein